MLLLSSANHKVQLITASAVAIDVSASYMDLVSGAVSGANPLTKITTATTTDIVPALASGLRNVKTLYIENVHATSSNLITLQVTDGTNVVVLEKVTLLAGERTEVTDAGIREFDSQGREKTSLAALPSGTASIAAQGPGFATDTYVTGSSFNVGSGRLQAGSFFRWYLTITKTAAGTATPIFNIRYGTAGTTADTARCTFTGAVGTAVADTARVRIEGVFRAVGASAVLQGSLQMSHNLAATGFVTTGPAGQWHALATSGTFDSSVANSIIGLSINGGTSAAWTIEAVTLDVVNLIV